MANNRDWDSHIRGLAPRVHGRCSRRLRQGEGVDAGRRPWVKGRVDRLETQWREQIVPCFANMGQPLLRGRVRLDGEKKKRKKERKKEKKRKKEKWKVIKKEV